MFGSGSTQFGMMLTVGGLFSGGESLGEPLRLDKAGFDHKLGIRRKSVRFDQVRVGFDLQLKRM